MAKGLAGVPASPGIVDGPVHLLKWEVPDVRHRIIHDEAIPDEIKRFRAALDQARARLQQVRARAEKNAGPQEAAIFDVQLSILEDAELIRQVEELIHQNLGAEKAFDLVLFEWRQQFASHV
ncbi:MAG TPA: phosphoenolpyruvate-utilizing N-terminal domain-containing protein, partial [Gemmatimonadaceae bacterium]|nr:phosphoenolpyruvate-utilizing N-terminal domain-containing protein [Gemmatimonadaceae bacterium]